MSDLWLSLLSSMAGLVIGFLGGRYYALKVTSREQEINGSGDPEKGVSPTAKSIDKTDFVIGMLVVLLALGVILQGIVTQKHQAKCNDEFRRVIAERASLTKQQNDADRDLQAQLADIGPGTDAGAEQARVNARESYVQKLADIDKARAANPYPDPRC